MFFLCLPAQIVKQRPAFVRRRGAGKTRAHALAGIGGEGELRRQQQSARRLFQTQIHFVIFVSENTIAQYPLQKPIGMVAIVLLLHADERENTGADLTDAAFFHPHAGFADTLNQGNHDNLNKRLRAAFTSASTVPASEAE